MKNKSWNLEKTEDSIKSRISDKNIIISITVYSGSREEREKLSSNKDKEWYVFSSTKDFYDRRKDFTKENKPFYFVHLDDYHVDVKDVYSKEQVLLVLKILATYPNLHDDFEIFIGNDELDSDKDIINAIKKLPVKFVTLNWKKL